MKYFEEYELNSSKAGWIEICYANIIVMLCLWLAFFLSPISLALVVLVFVYLEVGLFGFVLNQIRKNSVGYETLFISPRLFAKAFALKLVVIASICLWGLLLIVPGVIVALNYSLTTFVLVDNNELDIKTILNKSRQLVSGYRIKIFLAFLVSLLVVCIGVCAGFAINALLGLAFKVPIWLTVLLLVIFGGLAEIFVSMPLFETYLCSCYNSSLKQQEIEKKETKPSKKVVNKN